MTQVQHTELGITYTTEYAYDAAGRIVSMTYPDGRVINYRRDAIGRITGIDGPVNLVPTFLVSGRIYRGDGLVVSQLYGNGVSETRDYNERGLLLTRSIGGLDTSLYTYDDNDNLTDVQTSAATHTYRYDFRDQVSVDGFIAEIGTPRVFYDTNGNRTSDIRGSYSYSFGTNRLVHSPDGSVSLDAAGNTSAIGNRTFTYNNAGHLLESRVNGVPLANYIHDARGLRTRKVTSTATTIYHYDLAGRLIAETQADGALLRAYAWDDVSPVAQIDRDILSGQEEVLYLHVDLQGTPRVASDANQRVVWHWQGSAFGSNAPSQDPDGDGAITTINLRYSGQYFDAETGLYYNWHRYYDPTIGRYMTSDPISIAEHATSIVSTQGKLGGIRAELNSYAYVGNNPLRWIDPTGLEATVTIWQPVGWGSSSFGHVSTNVNGTTFSFGPGGMTVQPTQDYQSRNSFRSGVATTLNLTPEKEARLKACMSKTQSSYGTLTNNCGTPVQDCLKDLGYDLGGNILPVSLGNALLDTPGLVKGVDIYPATTPSTGSSAPWAK